MNVWYVTMGFPASSETFAGVEMRVLRSMNPKLSAHCFRIRPASDLDLLFYWGLNDLPVTWTSSATFLFAAYFLLRWPWRVVRLCAMLTVFTYREPVQLVKSFILLPRAFELFVKAAHEKPDVVHLFWGHYPSILGYAIQRWLPGTVVSVFLGAYDLVQKYPLSRPVAQNADIVWTHAKTNLPSILELGVEEDRLFVSYRGVDLRMIPRILDGKTTCRIVTAGRLVPEKGMENALHALKKVLEDFPNATLTVLGKGPDRDRLEGIVENLNIAHAVQFKGYLAHQETLNEFAQTDVFLLISRSPSERLPNVVKEAMACRCICLASITPGIEELIEDGLTGMIVPSDGWEEVAEGLCQIFSRPEQYESLRNLARNKILQQFDASLILMKKLERWKELSAKKK